MGARVHNATSLADLISDYLEAAKVTIVSFVPQWINLSHAATLNNQYQLGNNAILGDQVMDLSGKVMIDIGQLNEESSR